VERTRKRRAPFTITFGGQQTAMNKSDTSERAAWEDKLDQHEISLNSLLLGLSGALLAFGASYVKDGKPMSTPEGYFVGAAIILSSLSLSIGLWRSWLRSSAYRARLEDLTYDDQRSLGQALQENEEAILERAGKEILSRPGAGFKGSDPLNPLVSGHE
jgi:hypothetical protein